MIVGMWVENKKARTREFGATGKRLKKEYRYFHQQLDGTVIDPAECVCVPDFVQGEFAYLLACPIDDHKARARMALWDWDDDIAARGTNPRASNCHPERAAQPRVEGTKSRKLPIISKGRRPRNPGVTGARISA
jgi:hypothetical protein